MKKIYEASMAFADSEGNVYDYPGLMPAFRSGHRFISAENIDLIKLPYGSYLFSLQERFPVSATGTGFKTIKKSPDNDDITAVAAFPASAYLRTYLPAYEKKVNGAVLPLWAYTGLVFADEDFYIPAMRIDDDPRSDPALHENHRELKSAVKKLRERHPENRLVAQLATCSTEYNCLCARNFFLGRYECPVPSSPACNADCIGCLSFQDEGSGFCQSQPRLDFAPTPREISGVITDHFSRVEHAVSSFGQGCEGEPLLRGEDLAAAISLVREVTDKGTINCNTNGSRPDILAQMIKAGLDSVRISLCSPGEQFYTAYHRPVNYSYSDVIKSVGLALDAGIFVSINLFFMPGFTDSDSEVSSLISFLEKFPVNMIQTRNLNIDPDYFFDRVGFTDRDAIGISALIKMLRENYPAMRLGYYNPAIKQ
ncbi:MAG TPA: radical SAM protein [Spirochaetota bacterium]|nr:radical SAM protein [Spirochaetota bacterium]HQO40655.1 radical SAM protein [Spirochaetota bacterium]